MKLHFDLSRDFPRHEASERVLVRRVEVADLARIVAPRLVERRGSEVSFSFLRHSCLEVSFVALDSDRECTRGLCLVEMRDGTPYIVHLEGNEITPCLLGETLGAPREQYEEVFATDWQSFQVFQDFGFGKDQAPRDFDLLQRIEVAELYESMGRSEKQRST